MGEYVPTTGSVEAYYCTAKQEVTGVRDHSHHDEFRAWLAARDAEVAAKALKELETELVGSMEDGTYLATWTELTANEIRETIWEMFDQYRKAV